METENKKQESLVNFKKAQSHIKKIIEMVEGDQYCIDIMQQNLAVIGLLRAAHEKLMKNHLDTCFKDAIESKSRKKQKEMIAEILKVTRLFYK